MTTQTEQMVADALDENFDVAQLRTATQGWKVYSWFCPPLPRPDPLGENEYMVDRAGYIPAKQQIENLIAAGENLELYRARMYTNTDIPEIEPLDIRNMDEMDINDELKKRVRRIQIAQEQALRETKTAHNNATNVTSNMTNNVAPNPAEDKATVQNSVHGEVNSQAKGE